MEFTQSDIDFLCLIVVYEKLMRDLDPSVAETFSQTFSKIFIFYLDILMCQTKCTLQIWYGNKETSIV